MKKKTIKRKKILIISSLIIVMLVLLVKVYGMAMIKKMYGLRDPRPENEQSLLQTARKYKLNTVCLVTVAPEGYESLVTDFTGFPEVLIFDKQGRYIDYKTDKKACNAGVFGFIPDLDKKKTYKVSGKTDLKKTTGNFRDLKGHALPGNFVDTSADFYLLISWTAWTGRLNEDHVYKWQTLAAQNTKAKIQVIDVNLDAQQWWPQMWRDSVINMYRRRI